MSDRTPNTSSSSFFASPAAASAHVTPHHSSLRPHQPSFSTAAGPSTLGPAATPFVGTQLSFNTVGPTDGIGPNATPFVGTQLSFTPALTQPRHGFGLHAAPSTVGPATSQAFSTTPSVAVPLAFHTPAAGGAAARSNYVASNPLFALTGVGGGGGSASKQPQRSFPHLPSFGAHASLPSSLGVGALPPLPEGARTVERGPLRALVSSCLARGHTAGAVFYADKLATLESHSEESVYTLADAYARARHWSRAVHLLKKHSLLRLPTDIDDTDAELRMKALYLGLQCLLEVKQYEEALAACLPEDALEAPCARTDELLASVSPANQDTPTREILGVEEVALITQLVRFQTASNRVQTERGEDPLSGDMALCSSLAYLRGHLYELQSQKFHSILWYKLALHFDVRNFEAFERLTSKRLLNATEELDFTLSLPFPPHLEWLKFMWLNKIDVQRIDDAHEGSHGAGMGRGIRGDGLGAPPPQTSIVISTPNAAPASSDAATHALLHSSSVSSLLYRYRLLSVTYSFGSNADLLCGLIEYKYNLGQYRECYDLSSRIIANDPFMLTILPTYLCTLVELKLTSELFQVAHKLVAAYPQHAIAWFAVGCYYFLLRKLDLARRFFYKSTRCDCFFAAGWLGFGHTFSFTDESDQALLSYRTSHRLFEGSHLPLLCIGMEYVKTSNFVLATQFLTQAIAYNPYDPLPHNELGIIAFKSGDYIGAVKTFLHCLSLVKQEVLENWEPTLFNLGHAYRKQAKYAEAITAYNRALAVSARPCTILTAIGFTYHLQGEFNQAIDYYHKALGLNPRDTFTIDMLDRALKEIFEEGGIEC
jgi:anaphase-promoting complex subunit 6